ncbi:unnamed protein product [Notodromas monacha]|uniref:Uncharacterized protein n=1 Tax=Notodromas monacha TaxID=399045 RepID=A0A7R9GF54_9CRUS|nr:unnamed protein product [Notodromas monacha]CAG0920338.1 unnamed protein product [Notodromas monacha]
MIQTGTQPSTQSVFRSPRRATLAKRALASLNMQQNINNNNNVIRRPSSGNVSKVRRCLFGRSNEEDTENNYNIVVGELVCEFRNKWGFDVESGKSVPNHRMNWVKVDVNANVCPSKTESTPLKTISLQNTDVMSRLAPSGDVSMVELDSETRFSENKPCSENLTIRSSHLRQSTLHAGPAFFFLFSPSRKPPPEGTWKEEEKKKQLAKPIFFRLPVHGGRNFFVGPLEFGRVQRKRRSEASFGKRSPLEKRVKLGNEDLKMA